MPGLSPYSLATLISSAVMLTLGICLLSVSMPGGERLRNYRISRRMLGATYMILAGQGLAAIFWDPAIHAGTITPLLQAFLFTYALVTLLNIDYLAWRRVFWPLVLTGLATILVIINDFALESPGKLLAAISTAAYFGLFGWYVWIFFREYRDYKRRADDFYAGNERWLLRWVSQLFIIAAGIGALAGVLSGGDPYFWVFVVFYTLVYTYLAIRYINYITLYHRIAPAVSEADRRTNGKKAITGGQIDEAIGRWMDAKGHLAADITLEELAARLGINRTYLSVHINSSKGVSFREWISALRVEEARRIIAADPEKPLSEVAEAVGISTQSSFGRQFSNVAGVTPGRFREEVRGKTKKQKVSRIR